MSDEGMMVGGGGFDLLSRLGHGDALHKEARREIESLRADLAESEQSRTINHAAAKMALDQRDYLRGILADMGISNARLREEATSLDSRLAAAEHQRDDALVTLKTMLVADMTRNRDLWIKTWAKVPVLTAGVQIDAHLSAAREGEK